MAITRISTFAHTSNPTTAPTGTLSTTQADDIIVVFVTNGGSNSDPTLSGTAITTDGLSFTRKVSSGLGNLSGTMNGSLWWARATGNHSGRTIAAATVDSGSLVGGVYRGCKTTGDPFNAADTQTNYDFDGPTWYDWPQLVGMDVTVPDCMVLWGFCVDDDLTFSVAASWPSLTWREGSSGVQPVVAQALSTGGADTAVGFHQHLLGTATRITQAVGAFSASTAMNLAIVAALEPAAIPTLVIPRRADRGLIIR